MIQVVEIIVLTLLIVALKYNVYIKTHIGRLIMVITLVYLTMRNYLYGVVALAMIILVHEINIVEGNTNMDEKKQSVNGKKDSHEDEDEDENHKDDTKDDTKDEDEDENNEMTEDENEE